MIEDFSVMTVTVIVLAVVVTVGFYKRWIAHERARTDEIRRRERLRILLRREDSRK